MSIIYNFKIRMRTFTHFWFCADKYRFHAAEAILSMAYNHTSNHIILTEEDEKIKKYDYSLMLSDKIFERLDQMVQKQRIDEKTSKEFKKMFLPTQGILLQKSLSHQQNQRLKKASNNSGFVPFFLDPVMLGLVLKHKYKKGKNGKLVQNNLAQHVLYIVGTPGLGKSLKFIASKMINDFRIRHLIKKNGIQHQSIFDENFKFFYFYSMSSKKQIMKKIKQQIIRDFDYVPQYVNSLDETDQSRFQFFLSNATRAYDYKKIVPRIIIDQVNVLYELEQQQRVKHIRKWFYMFDSFKMPVIMISSKNSPFLQKYDPVIYFAKSTRNNIYHKKVVLDELISPQDRLNYSYSCFAFELLKYGLDRNQVIEIIRDTSLPILTHLSITNSVKKVFENKTLEDIKNSIKKGLQNNNSSSGLINSLNLILNSKQILQSAQRVLKKADFSNLDLQSKYYFNIILNLLSFSCQIAKQHQIKLLLNIKDDNNRIVQIKHELKIPKKQFFQFNFAALSESNYLFTTIINQKKYLFICTSTKQMERIRMTMIGYFTKNFLQNLRKCNYQEFEKIISQYVGFIFQGYVCNLYLPDQKSKINTFNSSFIFDDQIKVFKTNAFSLDTFSIQDENSLMVFKNGKSQFIKCSLGNQGFDFVLSDFQQKNKLRLAFVDTTVSNHSLQIIRKFSKLRRQLFSKKSNFSKKIIEFLSKDKQINLDVVCFVLTAGRLYQDIYTARDVQLLQEKIKIKEAQNQDKKLIEEGRQSIRWFDQELKKRGIQDRVKIRFGTGVFGNGFSIDGRKYTLQKKKQISQFATYLFDTHKQLIKIKSK